MNSFRGAGTSLAALNTQTTMTARAAVVECGVARSRRPEKKALRQYRARSFIRARTLSKSEGDEKARSDGVDDDAPSAVRKKTAARISRQSLKFSPKTASPFDDELFEEEENERDTPAVGSRFKGPSLLELEAESDALTRREEAAKKNNPDEGTFKITLGQIVLVASFTLITLVMLGTALFVIKLGAVHFNED